MWFQNSASAKDLEAKLITFEKRDHFSEPENATIVLEALRKELKPSNRLEILLVDQITASAWRLRRAYRTEKEFMEDESSHTPFMGETVARNLGKIFDLDAQSSDFFGKLSRYVASIKRSMYRALHELQRMQAKQNGDIVPLPVIVDVDASAET